MIPLLVALFCQSVAFPAFEAQTLNGQHVTIPEFTRGRPALLIFAFSHQARDEAAFWAKHIPRDLVTEYTAIDLEGGPRLTRPVTIASLRSGVPKNKRDRFLVIVRDSEAVRTAVHFSAADDPYLVLLGRDGAARWQYNGAFSHTVLKQLRDRIGAMRE